METKRLFQVVECDKNKYYYFTDRVLATASLQVSYTNVDPKPIIEETEDGRFAFYENVETFKEIKPTFLGSWVEINIYNDWIHF